MVAIDTTKLGVKTFIIEYADGSKDIVKPVSWKNLQDVQILQYNILENTANNGGSPGDVLNPNNKDFWEPAKSLAKMMPVVGKEGGIDLDRIEDMDQLINIFITTTEYRDPETGFISPGPQNTTLKPSEISRINGINFFKLLVQIQTKLQAENKSTSSI
jgi:hypothetical protein